MLKYFYLWVAMGVLAGCDPAEHLSEELVGDENSTGTEKQNQKPEAKAGPPKKPSGVRLGDLEKRDAGGNMVGLAEDGLWFKRGKTEPYTGLVVAFYNNGKMESQIHYRKGVRSGIETHWYENGQKRWEMNYDNGRMVSMKQWDVDGNEQK